MEREGMGYRTGKWREGKRVGPTYKGGDGNEERKVNEGRERDRRGGRRKEGQEPTLPIKNRPAPLSENGSFFNTE